MLLGRISSVQKTSATTVSAVGRSHTQHDLTMPNASQSVVSISEKDKARFWAKVDIRGEDECWEWTATKTLKEYGRIRIGGKFSLSHRVSFVIAHSEIPIGMFVCHSCDNPSCVNPAHLWIGTNYDNVQDMIRKGRNSKGENHKAILRRVAARGDRHGTKTHPESVIRGKHHHRSLNPHLSPSGIRHYAAKINEDDVRKIRLLSDGGVSHSKLSQIYNIHRATVGNIIRRETWKKVT